MSRKAIIVLSVCLLSTVFFLLHARQQIKTLEAEKISLSQSLEATRLNAVSILKAAQAQNLINEMTRGQAVDIDNLTEACAYKPEKAKGVIDDAGSRKIIDYINSNLFNNGLRQDTNKRLFPSLPGTGAAANDAFKP